MLTSEKLPVFVCGYLREFSACRVSHRKLAGGHAKIGAVQSDVAALDLARRRGNVIRLSRLSDDVCLLQQRSDNRPWDGAARADFFRGRRHQFHPVADEIAGRQRLGVFGECLYAAALRMAQHDDVLDLECLTPNSSAAETPWACCVRCVRRDDVRHVADNEELTRPGVKNDLRRHTGVAAADHHDLAAIVHCWQGRDSGPARRAAAQ